MPKTRYESLKSQFDEAIAQSKILEFIKVLEETNKASPVDYFFRACAYDIVGEPDKAYKHYALVVQLISAQDKHAQEIVKTIYQFIVRANKPEGQPELHEIIVKRALPGAKSKLPTKKTPNNVEDAPVEVLPKPKATVKKKDLSPTPPKVSPEQSFAEAKVAIVNKNLEKALELLLYTYNEGLQSAQCIILLCETFRRLEQPDKAIFYLNKGIKLYQETDDYLTFLTIKAQVYSSQKQWAECVKVYETLSKSAKEGSGQRRNSLMQVINIYRWYLEQPKKVDSCLKRLLKEFPDDPHALKLKAELQPEPMLLQTPKKPEPEPTPVVISNTQVIAEHPQPEAKKYPAPSIPKDMNEKSREIQQMGDDIEDLVLAINETCKNHEIEMIFTPTYLDSRIYRYLKIPVQNRESFTLFALNLYLLLFERTTQKVNGYPQKLGLIPLDFQRKHRFVLEVDAIRHAYGDAHITDSDIWQPPPDSIPVGLVLERYLGSKKSPQGSQFIDLQYGLLHSLRDYLNDLHYYVAQNV